MAINERLLQAAALRKQMEAQAAMGNRRGVQVSPLVTGQAQQMLQQHAAQQTQAQAGMSRTAMIMQQKGVAAGAPAAAPGGLAGFFGNSIVKGAMLPLQFLDLPRRAVISGVNEVADAFNGGDASFGDFAKQVGDPTFGFGDVVGSTGNKWLDRGIGFVGDVALDPVTYVLPGASEFAGMSGRATLAGEAALKDLGEEAVSRAARYGESALTQAERDALDLGKTGLRFGTPKHNVRIPGTGKLQEGLMKGMAAGRNAVGDTGVGTAFRRFRTDEKLAPFMERLISGKGEMSATEAANMVAALSKKQGAAGQFLGQFTNDVTRAAKDYAGRSDVAHALEAGVKDADTMALEGITKSMFKRSQEEGVTALQLRENFMPHYNTEDFEGFLGRANEQGAGLSRKGAKPKTSGRLESRVFEPNTDYTINGVDIHLDTATAKDITEKFQAAFPELQGRKLIEDDPGVWLPKLLEDHANDVGTAAWEKRMRAGGSLVDESDVMLRVPDKAATKDAEKELIRRAKVDMKARRQQKTDLAKAIRDKVSGAVKAAKEDAKAGVEREKARGVVAEEYLNRIDQGQAKVAQGLGAQRGAAAKAGADARAEWKRLYDEFTKADDEVSRLQKVWHISEVPTEAQAYQLALDKRQQLVEQIKAGLEAERPYNIAQAQLSNLPPPLGRTFVGQAEGPPTMVADPMAEAISGQQQGLLERTVARQGQMEQVADQLGGQAWDPTSWAAREGAALAPPSERFEQKLTELATGKPVMPRTEATHVVTQTNKRRVTSMRKEAQEAITSGAETGRSTETLRYGATERAAATRQLTPEQLVKPGILPDEVLAVAPPQMQQAWLDGQQRLDELMRPYRSAKAQAEAEAGRTPGKQATELDARLAWQARQDVEAEMAKLETRAKAVALNQGTGSKQWRDIQRKANELRSKLAEMKKASPVTQAAESRTPLAAAMMHDPRIEAVVRDQADMAEFMARKYRAVGIGTPDTAALDRDVVDQVLTSRAARVTEQAEKTREAVGKLRLKTDPGTNVPKYTDGEIASILNQEWKAHIGRHEAAYASYEKFERDAVAKVMSALNPPLEPKLPFVMTTHPTINGAVKEFEENVGADGMLAYHTAEGDQFWVESPQEYFDVWRDDFANQDKLYSERMAAYGKATQRYNRERESAVRSVTNKARASGARVPKRPPSKAEWMAERGAELRAQTRYVPSMSEDAATRQIDVAMAGKFREIVSALAEDVTAARKGKNQLDAAARKAGHSLPKTQTFVSNERIEALVPELRDMWAQVEAGEMSEPHFHSLVADAAETLKMSPTERQAMAEAMGRDTGGKFKPMEEWQKKGTQAPAETAEATGKRAESKQALRDTLNLQSQDALGLVLTDLRTSARRQVNETEYEFMRNVETLTGVKWDQPRAAITRTKGGRSTTWHIGGEEADIDAIRKHVLQQSGMRPAELSGVQAPDRMLKKWAMHAYETKFPAHPGLTEEGQIEWVAHMATKEEAINKMTEKQLATFMRDELRIKTGLEHVKLNRKLNPAEAQAAYLNGMADEMYKYIDQGQAGRIQGLYESMSPTAKASLHNTIADQAKVLDRELVDVNRRLNNIDSAAGGAAVTHDPIQMLMAKDRNAGVLVPGDVTAKLQASAIRPYAEEALPPAAAAIHGNVAMRQTAADMARTMEDQALAETRAPVAAARQAEEAKLAELAAAREEVPLGQGPQMQLQQEAIDREEQQLLEAQAAREGPLAEQDAARTAEWDQINETIATLAQRTGIAEQDLKKLLGQPTGLPVMGTRNLSDVAPRTQARADITALNQTDQRLAGLPEQFVEERTRFTRGQQAKDVAATEASTAELMRSGENVLATNTADTAARREALTQRVGELAPTVEQGQAARKELGGRSVGQLAGEIRTDLRRPLHEEMVAAAEAARTSKAAVAAHEQVMATMSADNQAALKGFHDAQQVLAGHEDAALQHAYNAEDLLKQAKAQVEHFKTSAPVRNTAKGTDVAQSYLDWIDDTEKFLGSDMPQQSKGLVTAALYDATGYTMPNGKIVGGFQRIDRKIAGGEQFIKDVRSGKVVQMMKDQMMSGYTAFKSSVTGDDLAMSVELDRAMTNLAKTFEKPGALGEALDTYTRFFKAYATATPGFHLRNAMSATFMNASDGVSIPNMIGGVKIWSAYKRNPTGEWWLHPSIAKYRDVAQDVVRAVYESGAGGQFSAQEIGDRAFGRSGGKAKQFVTNNAYIRGSKRGGEAVEGSVRAGMALDSLTRKGVSGRSGSLAGATQRINRIHFNYSQASKLDAKIRRVIPFWTFISRNVPLQVEQMWTNPRAYLHYQSFMRNFRDPNSDDSLLPQWMQQGGAFRVTPGLALMPDIGATQLKANVESLTTPSKLLSMLGPQFKVPLSMATNQNFFYGDQYSDTDMVPLTGAMSMAAPVLAAMGVTQDIPGGGMAAPRKYTDAVRDFIPLLANADRVTGDKSSQGIRSFLGIPTRDVTPEMLANEQKRRKGQAKTGKTDEAAMRRALQKLAG